MNFFQKCLNWGMLGNAWSAFHTLAGCVLYTGYRYLFRKKSRSSGLLFVLACALGWEFYEFLVETPNALKAIAVYGSVERAWYDNAGDVVLALAGAAMCMLSGVTG